MSDGPRYGWGGGGAYDERRNSSRVFPVAPDSHKAAVRALAGLEPALRRWIMDGYPTLTHDEHFARFGEPFKGSRPRKPTALR
jgi:hypothetical protein